MMKNLFSKYFLRNLNSRNVSQLNCIKTTSGFYKSFKFKSTLFIFTDKSICFSKCNSGFSANRPIKLWNRKTTFRLKFWCWIFQWNTAIVQYVLCVLAISLDMLIFRVDTGKTICVVPTWNTLTYCFNDVFLCHSVLGLSVIVWILGKINQSYSYFHALQ